VIGEALWRVIPDSAIKDGLAIAFAPGFDVPDRFVDDFRRLTYSAYDASPEAEDEYTESTPLDVRLSRAGMPLLAIFGAKEQIYDPRAALRAYARVPGARTRILAGAGHSPNVERPRVTARLILEFTESGETR
jgi:pimeloyl-ACP methyl ester carboxylesterase